jgi:hypothetical protein
MKNNLSKISAINIFTLTTSSVAIIITVLSFYLTYIHVNHSLKVAVTNDTLSYSSKFAELNIDAILLNYGNRPEVLLSSKLMIVSNYGTLEYDEKQPSIIKAGETSLVQFREKYPTKELFSEADWSEDKVIAKTRVDIMFTTADRKGMMVETVVPVWYLTYNDNDESVKFERVPRSESIIYLLNSNSKSEFKVKRNFRCVDCHGGSA